MSDASWAPSRPSARRGLLIAVSASVLWAVNGSIAKIALASGLDSVQLVSARSAGAAVVLLGWTALTRPAALRMDRRELGFLALYGVTGIAMVQWLYFVALHRLPVGVALLFEYTAPLMVALWVRFVQRRPVRSRLWLGLALALAGLAMVSQFWHGLVLDPVGVLSAVGAGAALASYYLMGERGQRRRDPVSLMGWTFGFSALLWAVVRPWWAFPYALLSSPVRLPSLGSAPLWTLVLWVILLGTLAPFLLVLYAVPHLGPARVGLVGMLEPVVAGALAWVWLGESLAPVAVAGSAVVLTGIVLAETSRVDPQPQPAGIPAGVAP